MNRAAIRLRLRGFFHHSLLAGFLITSRLHLPAQSDNFDNGSDAGWARLMSATSRATYSFPPDALGGHASRLQGAATPSGGAGRVIAYRPERIYTNFYVAADIVGWDNSLTNDQVFGVLARA